MGQKIKGRSLGFAYQTTLPCNRIVYSETLALVVESRQKSRDSALPWGKARFKDIALARLR